MTYYNENYGKVGKTWEKVSYDLWSYDKKTRHV